MPDRPPTCPPLPRPKRRLPWEARLLFVFIGCAILAIPGFYIEERIRGAAAWKDYRAEAQQRGLKLDFADYIPPKVPDAENFASTPIFDAVFRASDQGPTAETSNPFLLPKTTSVTRPLLSDPEGQKPVDLAAWQKYFVEIKWLPAAGDDAAADVLKALQRLDAPLAQLREAARRPRCSFPVDWNIPMAARLPHLPLLQEATKIHALRMEAHLVRGENEAALEDFRDGLRLISVISAEPGMISGLVRLSNATVLENAVWSGLASHRWADSELRAIDADLVPVDWLKDCVFTMSTERAAQNALLDMVINDPRQFVELMSTVVLSGRERRSDAWVFYSYPTGWLYQTEVRLNGYIDELLARFDLSRHRWHGDYPTPLAPENVTSLRERMRFMLFGFDAPAYKAVEQKYVRAATVIDQTRLACALERFRVARGGYPAVLAELSPEYLLEVPLEVVNGEPYRYRRPDGEHFVLYSVGFDLHDDGGVIDPKLKAAKQKDWVWCYPEK